MDGKTLIKTYGTYMQERFKNKNPEKIKELQNLLLLHNQEDVQNLPAVSKILSYTDLFQSLPEIVNEGFYTEEQVSELVNAGFYIEEQMSKLVNTEIYTKKQPSEILAKNTLSSWQIPDCYVVTFSLPPLFTSMLKNREENLYYPIPNSSQIPRSKLTGHQTCNAAELRGIRPSRQSPNGCASTSAQLVARGNKTVMLQLSEEHAILTIPVINDVLKYYYPNYKDYYYLPKEDKAIHKSVGIYVEKEYRKKATADTAYLSRKGLYLPQPTPVFTPAFQYERKDELSFFQLTETTDVHSETFQLFLLQWWRKFLNDVI